MLDKTATALETLPSADALSLRSLNSIFGETIVGGQALYRTPQRQRSELRCTGLSKDRPGSTGLENRLRLRWLAQYGFEGPVVHFPKRGLEDVPEIR